MELHEIIRTFRTARGMSQVDLAKAAGYTDQSAISKIESGKVDLPQSKIKLFAHLLQIPIDLLIGEEPYNLTKGMSLLPENVVVALTAAGLRVEPGFDATEFDFNDVVGKSTPKEIYNVIDTHAVGLARFTGDELRGMQPDARVVREAFEDRCITGTTAKGIIYKMIDSLPEDKLPIIEAYLEGMLSK